MSMTIALYARRQKWPLQAVEIRLQHSRDHAKDCEQCMTKKTALDHIHTEVTLDGALSAEQRDKLLEIGGKCPVHQTLESGIKITAVGAWAEGNRQGN
jgi:putative redox protein